MALEQLSNTVRTVGKFELSLAGFSGNSFDVSGQASNPTEVRFNSDGTRMFVIDNGSDSVHQYDLTTGFDVSTASFAGTSFDVSGQATEPRGVAFNSDGTRMFVIGGNSDSVHQYDLTTGFDVSTASVFSSFDVSAQDVNSRGVTFNPDGTRMFVVGQGSNSVNQYDLTTGFDVSTASFTGTSFGVSGQDGDPRGVVFNSDGTRMFVIGNNSDSVFAYLVGRLRLQD